MKRIRVKEHVDGSWSCLISSPVALDNYEIIVQNLNDLLIGREKVEILDLWHVSLSRTFYVQVQHHSFLGTFMKDRLMKEPFPLNLRESPIYFSEKWEIFANESETRFFLALLIDPCIGNGILNELIGRIDCDLMEKFDWPKFYPDPRFHVSIAWSDDRQALQAFLSENRKKLNEIMDLFFKEPLYLSSIQCQLGNRIVIEASNL